MRRRRRRRRFISMLNIRMYESIRRGYFNTLARSTRCRKVIERSHFGIHSMHKNGLYPVLGALEKKEHKSQNPSFLENVYKNIIRFVHVYWRMYTHIQATLSNKAR